MARCSGGASCNCIIAPGQGINLIGNGGLNQPYVPSVRVSRDAGNCVRFGSDGGVFSPCSDEEAADICGISVGNLPEERLVFGRGGAGRLLAPDHTLASFRRAVELGMDGSHAHVRELGDGTPVCFPSTSMTNQTGIPDLALADMGVGGYKSVPIRAGWSTTDTENLGGRHGFFGFGEQDEVGGATLAEVLATVGRRSVLLLQMLPPYSDGFPQKVLRLINRYCAHEAVIIGSTDIDDLEPFVTAALPTCAFLETEASADETPPAMVQERGVEWVAARVGDVTTTQMVGYSTAGMNLIGFMCSRHHEWTYLDEVGARGCISDDGLYMTMDPERYRSPTMAEKLHHPQVQPGMLGYWTDPRRDLPSGPGQPGEVYWPGQGRGFYFPRDYDAANAFYMPLRGTTSPPEPNGTAYRTPSGVFDVSMGFVNPIPWPDDYTLDVQISFRDTPAVNRPAGLLLGLDDDRAFEDRAEAGGAYWTAGIRWSGSLFVERWEDGARQSFQTVGTSRLTEDAFYRLRFIVTPEEVAVQRLSASGEMEWEARVADSATRGPYTSFFKNELNPDNGGWAPYAVAWRNLVITPNTTDGERVAMRAPAPVLDEDARAGARERDQQ
ncbi:glycerophosphodiester phosphodiesterase [Nocardiopsis alba]|uniref:glycerophosphodiester phosphodiesterase n=1 Tax=Nocardiopsis alba TaxID=53437 RepID=UPI0033A95721